MKVSRKKPQRLAIAASFLSIATGMLTSCSPPSSPDVIVITLDTTRADRLGCYGHPAGLTPNLDALALEGVRFDDASTVTPITLPSHASIFTGRYPTSTGVRNNGSFRLPDDETTLAERLQGAGWKTAAVIGAFPLTSDYGLGQGFDRYDEDLPTLQVESEKGLPLHFNERNATSVTDRALAAWDEMGASGEPVFLWAHYFDPHAPYDAPERFEGRGDHPYDDEIAYLDHEVGRLVEQIRRRSPKAIIVIVSDHGEALGEHDEKTHGVFLYQGTIRVPWILVAPGRVSSGSVVATPVSVVDLTPTVLSLAGLDLHDKMDGVDLGPLLQGQANRRDPIYAESYLPRLQFRFHELTMWRDGKMKYIEAPLAEVYDLELDPEESRNLHGGFPEEAEMAAALAGFRLRTDPASGMRAEGGLDAEAEAKLRSLGYASAGTLRSTDETRARDPKSMTDYLRRYDRAIARISSGAFDEGVETLQAMIEEAPENYMVHYQIAAGLMSAGRLEESEAAAREVTRKAPEFANGYLMHADILSRMGRYDAARDSFRAAATVMPYSPLPYIAEAEMWVAAGRFPEAVRAYEKAIDASPGDLATMGKLIQLLRSRGNETRALEIFVRLTDAHPDSAAAWTARAEVAHGLGDTEQTETALQKAGALAPDSSDVLSLTARLEEEQENWVKALPLLKRLVHLRPDSSIYLARLGRAQLRSGQPGPAGESFRTALQKDPGASYVFSYQGAYAEDTGQTDAARALYRQAASIDPNDRDAYEGLTRLRNRQP
jgi:arylsulfatase A-like enzyme/Tfp pilus assembly protein PilF